VLSGLYTMSVKCANILNVCSAFIISKLDFWGDTLINLKQELQNYPPINLKAIEENTPGIPDEIKNSIILYNKALDSIRLGSEDIAIIELKKAVSMNPNFYEAMNLLGVCYTFIKDYDKASEVFKKVASAENNGIKAQQYLKLLDSTGDSLSSSGTPKHKSAIKKSETGVRAKPKDAKPISDVSKTVRSRDVLKYIACAAAGALIVFLAMQPFVSGLRENSAALDTANAEKEVLSEKLAGYESDYKTLEQKYETLKSDLEAANASVDYYKSCIKLFEAENMFSQRNYEAAADMLVLLRTVDFNGEDKERFDTLNKDVMPAAANAAFNEGYRLLSLGQYQNSLDKLNKIQIYIDDYRSMDQVLYYIGKCYIGLNDSRNAIATFQKIIGTYPQSKYSSYSKLRINELTRIP
jgi:tetratricopeptide (TPR) repeat protein